MDTRGNTDPAEARDVAAFLAMLRELKECQGLTYRQLEQRAAEQGEVLARSTLADVLSGRRLPRPEVLSVFVRACGESSDRATAWLDARAEVAARARAAKAEPAPAGPATTEQTAPRGTVAREDAGAPATGTAPRPLPPRNALGSSSARRTAILIAAAVVLALAVTTAWMATAGDPPADPAPKPEARSRDAAVPAGWIRIRPAAAPGLCVTDGRVQDGRYTSLVAVQRPCGGVAPQRTELEPVGTDTYRIAWVHPEHGKGCLKALSGGAADGLLEPWESCGQASSFRVEPDPDPGPGSEPSGPTRQVNGGKPARYVFRADGEQCLGVRGDGTATGAEVTLQRCTGRENQTFLIGPAP
ncbi:helix-turn-helix domain-containing protein [Streptomyces monomycini]|uniref:helix-turn-helix domain-containing protein n=1 Tax=Streptomyces monomycini TaxID=371720 RepID=UPI0004AA4E3A|nr:helix-turn-helix transcriptional regulator [Streptomyces monomycini]